MWQNVNWMHLSPPRGTEFIDGNAYLSVRQWANPECPGHPSWKRSYKDKKGIKEILMIFATIWMEVMNWTLHSGRMKPPKEMIANVEKLPTTVAAIKVRHTDPRARCRDADIRCTAKNKRNWWMNLKKNTKNSKNKIQRVVHSLSIWHCWAHGSKLNIHRFTILQNLMVATKTLKQEYYKKSQWILYY